MSQLMVVPKVPIEPVSDEMMRCLRVIWRAARDDSRAFRGAVAGLERGLIFELYKYHAVSVVILSLQPTRDLETYPRTPPPRRLAFEQMLSFIRLVFSAPLLVFLFLSTFVISSRHNDGHAPLLSLHSVVQLALGSPPPLDAYTVQLLQGLWDLAVAAPDCLDDYVQNRYSAEHSRLIWCLWNLKRNNMFRIRDVGASPVQMLPNDALVLIFRFLRVSTPLYYDPEDSYQPHRGDAASHLQVRLVCKHWFTLIDETSRLWAPMNLGFGFDWTVRALHKSKAEALDVRVHTMSPERAISPAVMLNLAEFRRLRRLDFHAPWNALEIVSHHIASSEAPLLEILTIHPGEDGFPGQPLDNSSFRGVPPPKLKAVDLSQWSIHPTCPIFLSPLVTLNLTGCAVWPSLDSLVITLRSLPSLERFVWSMSRNTLRNLGLSFHFPTEAFLHSEQPPVPLPRLKKLELELPIACIAAIMAHVIIPVYCVLNIQDDYSFSGDPDDAVTASVYQALDASVGAHLQRLLFEDTEVYIDSLYVREDGEVEPGRSLVLEASAGRSHTFGLAFLVADVVDGEMGPEALLGILRHIFAWPVFGNRVTYLLTSHEAMAGQEAWAMVLDAHPAITTVVIEQSSHSDPSGAVRGLTRTILQRAGNAQLLSTLTLSNLHLHSDSLQLLVTAIEIQHRRGASALALNVFSCTGLENDDEVLLDEVLRRYGGQLHITPPFIYHMHNTA